MRSNNLRLLSVLLVLASMLAAGCARLEPPTLPPPIVADDAGTGWRSY